MAQTPQRRSLAAIVVIDVVGYSRMMGEDESGTLAHWTRLRADLVAPTVERYNGRVVKELGDGVLVAFVSAVEAVRCAIAVQRGATERGRPVNELERLTLRAGVNVGDVIFQGGDVFGDGVNVAARIETLAEPGGLCLSRAAFEQVQGKIDAPFTALGAQSLKNIARPVDVFALSAEAIAGMPAAEPVATARPQRRVVWYAAAALGAAALAGASFAFFRPGVPGLPTRLNAELAGAQAGGADTARAKLVEEYLALKPHRAFAIAPRAKAHWWTGDWADSDQAKAIVLERCQMAYDEPCVVVAVDDAIVEAPPGALRPAQDAPRLHLAGDFDVAAIPTVRDVVRERADVRAYAGAPGPKATAIHPRGILTLVLHAASPAEAEAKALKLCNDNDARKEADGPCFLYTVGNHVVLPERHTEPVSKP